MKEIFDKLLNGQYRPSEKINPKEKALLSDLNSLREQFVDCNDFKLINILCSKYEEIIAIVSIERFKQGFQLFYDMIKEIEN